MRFLSPALLTGLLFTQVLAAEIPLLPPSSAKNDSHYQALEVLAKGLYYIESVYVDPQKVSIDTMVISALEGILQTLDPHSVVINPQAFEQLGMKTKGAFGGIGIVLTKEADKFLIVSIIENTPAEKAGLQAGDEIIAVDGKTLAENEDLDVFELLQGAPGSSVRLVVLRKEEAHDYTVRREVITLKSFQASELDGGFYYSKIASFQGNTASDLEAFLLSTTSKIKGLILDLRDNPGGLLDQAVKVVDLFIDKGLIVSTIGRDPERIEREFSESKISYTGFPMIVLINAGSASASEIVAGALQDHRRALILGTKSFGKGSVQTLIGLPNGAGLKITVARYYTPNNRSIQAKGIEPDIVVQREQAIDPSQVHKLREENLRGHIASKELQIRPSESAMGNIREHWSKGLQNDQQVFHAYTYLKGWSVFKF